MIDWRATLNMIGAIESKLALRRTAVLAMTVWMTWRAFGWAAEFASTTDKSGLDVAAIIAAVTAPISFLQSAVFGAYIKGKSDVV